MSGHDDPSIGQVVRHREGVKDTARRIVAAAEAAERAERDRIQRERQERNDRAAYVLAHAPINEWFPESTWDIIDFTAQGTSLQYQSDGSDIIVQSDDGVCFALSMNLRDAGIGGATECEVHVVELHRPVGAYEHEGPYYRGSKVKSVEDVARVLKAMGAL